MRIQLLLFLILGSSYLCNAVVAIDRSDEVKFNVVIENRKKIEGLPGTLVKMTSSVSKRKYECLLPEEWDSKGKESEDGNVQVDVPTLLKPLSGQCIYRLNGWWTYEFCVGNHIRQYHQERDLPVRPQDEFFLGRWKEGPKRPDEHHKEGDYQFYSTQYSDGTVCDLTGQKRSTEVRFSCAADKTVTTITDVKEPYSCHYIMTVTTPLICSHPSYRPKRETVKSIYCCPEPIEGEEVAGEEEINSQEVLRDRETLDRVFKQAEDQTPEYETEVPVQQEVYLDFGQLVESLKLSGLSNSELQTEIMKGIQEAIREQQELNGVEVLQNKDEVHQLDPAQLEELQRNQLKNLEKTQSENTLEQPSHGEALRSDEHSPENKKNKKEL